LAAFTLVPQLIAMKVLALHMSFSLASLIFVVYHAIGIKLFFDVKTLSLPQAYSPSEFANAIRSCWKLKIKHALLGYVVLALLVLTVFARAQLQFGTWHGALPLPSFVYSLVGVSPPESSP